MPAEDNILVSIKTASERLNKHPETIRGWYRSGRMQPAGEYVPKHGVTGVLFKWSDVLAAYKEIERLRNDTKPAKPLSEPDKAYLAGLIDGEGCFSGSARTRSDCKNPRQGQYTYRCAVNMTVKAPLHWAHAVTGLGHIYNQPAVNHNEMRQPIWAWHVYGRQAGSLAEAILPYLKVKREQALIVIEINKVRLILDPKIRVPLIADLVSKLRFHNRRSTQIARDAGLLFIL